MNTSFPFLVGMTIAAGGLLPIQFALNAKLAGKVDSTAIWAALISVIVSTVFLLGLAALTLEKWPRLADLKEVPMICWTGGLLGALFVATSTFVVPKIGAGVFVAAVLFGQIIVSTAMDHNGWLGVPIDPITLQRVSGVVLIFAGLWLIRGL